MERPAGATAEITASTAQAPRAAASVAHGISMDVRTESRPSALHMPTRLSPATSAPSSPPTMTTSSASAPTSRSTCHLVAPASRSTASSRTRSEVAMTIVLASEMTV